MRDRAAFEVQRRDRRTDHRGDRTADLTTDLGRAGVVLPECRSPPIGEAGTGNRRRCSPAGPVRRCSGYDSALDEIAHLLTCRMSRPDPALFPMNGVSPVKDKSDGRWVFYGSLLLALECGLRKALHITTGARGPKVAP